MFWSSVDGVFLHAAPASGMRHRSPPFRERHKSGVKRPCAPYMVCHTRCVGTLGVSQQCPAPRPRNANSNSSCTPHRARARLNLTKGAAASCTPRTRRMVSYMIRRGNLSFFFVNACSTEVSAAIMWYHAECTHNSRGSASIDISFPLPSSATSIGVSFHPRPPSTPSLPHARLNKVWSELEKTKGVIVEETEAASEFKATKKRYEAAIDDPKRGNAVLLAVYRGKMSEVICYNCSSAIDCPHKSIEPENGVYLSSCYLFNWLIICVFSSTTSHEKALYFLCVSRRRACGGSVFAYHGGSGVTVHKLVADPF